MKREFKSILSITLALIMAFSVLPFAARMNVKAKSDNPVSDYHVGDLVAFGSYPQSKVTDSSLIPSLDSVSEQYEWISYGYYSGTGDLDDGQMQPSDYMRYKDFWYSGTKYRAVTFSQFRPCATGHTSYPDRSSQDENGYTPNNVYYFEYEPLKWRILDPEEGLVMCENIIDSQAYNNYVLHANGEDWGDSAKTYYSNNWAKCSLRQWLNDDFYNTAFSSTQKNYIKTSYLENKSAYSSSYDAPSTYDKIFLLSYWDAINSNYGFSSSISPDSARKAQGTDYAKCQGLLVSTSSNYYGNAHWCLRTPGDYSSSAFLVDSIGSVGYGGYNVRYTDYGVRPALKFNPKSSIPGYMDVSVGDISLGYKSSATLTPQITANDVANYTVTYSSSNPSAVSVDQNGKVTSNKTFGFIPGSAVITVTVTDSSNGNSVSDTCTVTVQFSAIQWIIKILLFGWIWY